MPKDIAIQNSAYRQRTEKSPFGLFYLIKKYQLSHIAITEIYLIDIKDPWTIKSSNEGLKISDKVLAICLIDLDLDR